MKLVSTRGRAPSTDVRTAVYRGLAPDGGLYVPASLPRLSPGELDEVLAAGWPGGAQLLARRLLSDEWAGEELERIVREALDFPVPLRRVGERMHVLELFHGPTLAFKDVGARFLALSMAASAEREDAGEPPTVLVATSGDTGSAVGDAFRRLTNFPVVILFPAGGISERQERHLTRLRGNVTAVAVGGSFDDCQELAKRAFADRELREGLRLTSANSINVGRLLPQLFYHFHAVGQLEPADDDGERLVSVPSGNLGNLTAGLMAKRMGLGVSRFVAGTNRNDVLPRYLRTGRAEPRPAVSTPSTAMDVGDPSNLERLRHLYGDDVARLRRDLTASSHGDEVTRRTIAGVSRRHGYLLDPHTAVGWRALERELEDRREATGIVLSTAHPAKFEETVGPLVDADVPVPDRWSSALEGDDRRVRMEPELDSLRSVLSEAASGGP